MRVIDLDHLGTPHVIATWEHDGVLVDPGPQSCEAALLAGLGEGYVPEAILLTHIHLDHAGATGTLLRRWPHATVFVSERGARHVADPSRLVSSAARLYGEDRMATLWGEVAPVPAERIVALDSTAQVTILDGAFRAAPTPGHASHHTAYLHVESGRAFTGDVAGVRIAPESYVVAPTPPPDIDVAAWNASLDVLEAWAPTALALTHFGSVDDAPTHLAAVREALAAQVEIAAGHDLDGFVTAMQARAAAVAPDAVAAYAQAAPLAHQWMGLARWRERTTPTNGDPSVPFAS